MTKKILVAGSCVVDLIFKGKVFQERTRNDRLSLAFGGKYVPEEMHQCYGGGGANMAVSLAKQGFMTHLWSHVGNDAFGRQAVRNLRRSKVKTNLVKFKARNTALSTILLTPSGERTIINYRSDADLLSLNNAVLKTMEASEWFAMSSLVNCPKKDKIDFLKQAKKSESKILLSLHGTEYLRGYEYLKEYLNLCDILHINAHELADIFGGNAPDFDFKRTNFSHKLQVPLLLVTYDVRGSYAYTSNRIYHQPIFKTKEIQDTTGAGDAFAAGFLGEYLKTDSIKKGLTFASKNAASVIQQLGAQNGLLTS